jgi:hypothetical protein
MSIIQIIIWVLSLLAPQPAEPVQPAPVEHQAEIGTALFCERLADSTIRCTES